MQNLALKIKYQEIFTVQDIRSYKKNNFKFFIFWLFEFRSSLFLVL